MIVSKIDSNVTGLRIAEEESLRTLPNTPDWIEYEPNSYSDFGGEITKVARNPINSSRQRSKGVTTDLDASGGFNTDLTQKNLQEILQGLMFADFRRKGEEAVVSVDGATETYEVGDTEAFYVGSLVLADGHDNSANDGLKRVTAVVADVHAFGTLDADADSFTALDTITINGVVYTFRATIDEDSAAYSVLLSGTTAQNITRLISAINGTGVQATDYGIGTYAHPDVVASEGAGDTLVVTAIVGGSAGNAITTTKVTTDTDIVWGGAVLASGANGSITVFEDLVTEASPSGDPTLVVVGFQFAASDVDIDVSGTFPAFQTVAKDLTQLGVIPGEPVYVGGDSSIMSFASATDNGIKRVRSVATNAITFDKSDDPMVVDAGTGKTIQMFFGRVLKNEAAALIVRRTWQLERTLGAPDDQTPADVQAEYLPGSLLNTGVFNIPSADKINVDLGFLSLDNEQVTYIEGLKAGNRPTVEDADAFNTSTDFSRIKLARVVDGNEAPSPLFAYVTSITLNVNNNGSLLKAVGTLGGFDINVGQFTVGGSIEAYFADVQAVAAVRDNDDVTLDIFVSRNNAGFCIDIPLIALGNGRLNVQQDQAILVPLDTEAARGKKIDADLDHTLLFSFFDYLPTVSED